MEDKKIVMRVGALIGITNVILSFIIPERFGWYRIGVSSMGITGRGYITGIGTLATSPGFESAADLVILVLIGSIVIIIGAILIIVSGEKRSKVMGVIGGILMFLGPWLLIIDLLSCVSDIAKSIDSLLDVAGGTVFNGSYSEAGYDYIWGLYGGFHIGLAAGIIGLIGIIIFFLKPSDSLDMESKDEFKR